MDRARLDNWCERGILALVLAVLVFGPLATGAVRVPDFLVIQSLTLGAALLWTLRLWLNPRPQLLWPPVCWAVLAFTAYAAARWLTADIEYIARLELSRVLVYALLFFIVLNNVRPESARLVVFTLVVLATAVSFYALYQFLSGSDRVWAFVTPYKHRGCGTYICPNHLAGFLEMLLPLALAFAIESRVKPPVKILLGYAALVMAAALAITMSRGGWLAAGGALMLLFAVFLWRRHLRRPALLVALALAAVAGIVYTQSPTLQLRAQKIFSRNSQTSTVDNLRFELWQPAVRIWRDNFWFGGGPAHFDERFRAHRPQNIQMRPDHAHNDYLETLADWGAAGAAVIAAAVAWLGIGAWKTWRAVRPDSGRGGNRSNKSALVLGAAAGLFALLLHSAVDFNMHIPANAILAVSLMALLAGHQRFATAVEKRNPDKRRGAEDAELRGAETDEARQNGNTDSSAKLSVPPRSPRLCIESGSGSATAFWLNCAVTVALLAAVVFLGAQGWRRGREHVLLQRAALAVDFSPAQTAAWQSAYAVEPKNFTTTYALGEVLRVQSMDGNRNYAAQAQQAIAWYERGMKLNPHDANNWLRRGMCRDWLEQHDAAAADFAHAEALDPNNYFIVAYVGWHEVQVGNYAAAREYFERSIRLDHVNNPVAMKYLEIVNRRLRDAAARP